MYGQELRASPHIEHTPTLSYPYIFSLRCCLRFGRRPLTTRTEPAGYDMIIQFFSSLHSFYYQTIMVGNYDVRTMWFRRIPSPLS